MLSLLNITYRHHVTKKEVRNKIKGEIGKHDDLRSVVKKRKLRWYGHILTRTILQGAVK